MVPIQDTLLRTLAGHSTGLTFAEIVDRLKMPAVRLASALYSAGQRGHVAKIADSDGSIVFSITAAGTDALCALDVLAQRMDEKRHPVTRQPPTETSLTQARHAAQEARRKCIPNIDPEFALDMARRLHASKLSMPTRVRQRLAKIVQEAA